jgi:DNA-binding NarL/FixJ family response regulator
LTAVASVVLADDNADLRNVLRLNFELAGGFAVVGEADHGAAALRLVEELHPDVLVLDLVMDEADGHAVIEAVRRAAPGTSVVVLSGCASAENEARALAGGAASYIVKCPELLRTVVATVRALVAEAPVG